MHGNRYFRCPTCSGGNQCLAIDQSLAVEAFSAGSAAFGLLDDLADDLEDALTDALADDVEGDFDVGFAAVFLRGFAAFAAVDSEVAETLRLVFAPDAARLTDGLRLVVELLDVDALGVADAESVTFTSALASPALPRRAAVFPDFAPDVRFECAAALLCLSMLGTGMGMGLCTTGVAGISPVVAFAAACAAHLA